MTFPRAFAALVLLSLPCLAQAQNSLSPVGFSDQDRILVLSPHPDDDVLGCGGIIQTAVARGLPVKVVYLTYGDNYEWAFLAYKKRLVLKPSQVRAMGLMRREEAIAAEKVLGVPTADLSFLGYPDWGTERIWMEHWGTTSPPFRSMLTRVTAVPYANAVSPGAPYKGDSILADIEKILRDFKPTKVFVSQPGDAHRDHRSFYLFAQIALWDVQDAIHPDLYPFLVHHPRWPLPRGLIAGRTLQPPDSLMNFTWFSNPLSDLQLTHKIEAIRLHRTQMVKDARYLYSFMAANELFSWLPEIRLRPSSTALSLDPPSAAKNVLPEDVEPVQAAWNVLHREHENLILTLKFSKTHRADKVRIFAFGYRRDRPFRDMPKIRIIIGPASCRVYDQRQPQDASLLVLERKPGQMTLAIPLALLGNPEKLLGTVWSRDAEEPFDWHAWRVIDLQENPS